MASPPLLDDPAHAARRAKTRVAIAAVLLTIAIGGLTLLTRQQPQNEAAGEPTAAQKQESISSEPSALPDQQPAPAQISSKDIETPAPVPPAPVPAVPETPEPVKQTAAAPVVPPPPPQVSNPQPIKNTPTPPKANAPKSAVPSEPFAPAAAEPKKPELKSKPAEVAKPASTATPIQPQTKPAVAPKSFVVQVGVFTDMDNAKVLQSKLAENGIPSHTETKLQVGPFNTKAEADTAREKLKNLGIGSVVVPGK